MATAPAHILHRDACKVLTCIEDAGFAARLAGGCVRDRLLGLTPKDFDVATTATPDKVLALMPSAGWKAVPTGIDHGTVTVVLPSGPVEVTTLRKDVATDGRRATVAFSDSFAEDASRRDFTINAMYEDAAGKIYDYFQGQDHLRAKQLVFVGEPAARIAEDYLRILRLFRFWARYQFLPAPGTLEAVQAGAAGLQQISQERCTSELLQILACGDLKPILQAMQTSGTLEQVLPHSVSEHPPPDYFAAPPAIPEDWRGVAGLAALCHLGCDHADAEPLQLAKKLRLANKQGEGLATLHTGPAALAAVAGNPLTHDFWQLNEWEQKLGPEFFMQVAQPYWRAMALAPASRAAVNRATQHEEKYGARRRQALPIDGNWIMRELAVPAGSGVGEALRRLTEAYWERHWQDAAEAKTWWQQQQK